MLQKVQERTQEQNAFALVELLVAILIVGVLAAVALPSLLSQRGKAQDAEAKSHARSAATAAHTFASEHGDSYAEVDGAALVAIEPTLSNASGLTASGTATTFTTSVTSPPSNRVFTISHAANGAISRTCTVPAGQDKGGCSASPSGTW